MILNIVCLIIWIIQLVLCLIGEPISTGVYICACVVCILFYIEKLVM